MELKDIYPAVLTIVLIGIILGIGLYVMAEVNDEMYTSATGSANVESVSVNATGYTLSNSSYTDFSLVTIVIYNVTKPLESANYTATDAGVITNASDCGTDATSGYECDYLWLANYTFTYNIDTDATLAVEETIDGVGDFAGWIAVIVVVMAAGIVLGIVLKSFGRETPGI